MLESLIDFFKENYKWLFDGIGVAVVGWIISIVVRRREENEHNAKESNSTEAPVDTRERLLEKSELLPPKIIEMIDENGLKRTVEVIIAFQFKDTKQEYVVYTEGERDKYGNTTVYVSRVDRSDGGARLLGVDDENEWCRVRDVLRELAQAEPGQPLFDEEGIEIL